MPARRLARFIFRRRLTTAFAALLLAVVFTGASWSRTASAQPQSPAAPQSSTTSQSPGQPSSSAQSAAPQEPNGSGAAQVPGVGVAVQNQQPRTATGQAPEQPEPETRITKDQAKELFRSVDEILDFVSHDTGLPIEHKVKRNLITRESVEKYVNKRMKEDKDEKRLEQSRLVLQKFGLLPPGYDLHAEFLRLMAEQVAAYYDPKTKSVNLLDWVQLDAQKPILAHELTHALQDQKVGVDKWELAGAKDDSALPDQQEYSVEEAQSARQCVTEGQGMAVMFDYMLAPLGKNLLTAPGVVAALQAGMADSKDSPVFAQAPMFLKESLLMPYTFGLDFVRTVLAKKGKEAAFAGILEDPPVDTRQIMQPETYLSHHVVAPPPIPDFDKLVAPAYERLDFGSMGEFDVYLLAKQYGANDPPNYYRHWRGGYYFAAQARTAPKDQIAMLYYSRWDSPEAAHDFAKLYADYLPKRYKKAVLQRPSASDTKRPRNLYVFDTDEGKALIEIEGNDMLIMEGYDDGVIQKARDVVLFGMSLPAQPVKGKD
jgi:hypothetical protein